MTLSRFCHAPDGLFFHHSSLFCTRNKPYRIMAAHQKPVYGKMHHPFYLKEALLHWLLWLLFAAALFYAADRYFEYRERELDKRLERLR